KRVGQRGRSAPASERNAASRPRAEPPPVRARRVIPARRWRAAPPREGPPPGVLDHGRKAPLAAPGRRERDARGSRRRADRLCRRLHAPPLRAGARHRRANLGATTPRARCRALRARPCRSGPRRSLLLLRRPRRPLPRPRRLRPARRAPEVVGNTRAFAALAAHSTAAAILGGSAGSTRSRLSAQS